VLDQSEPVRRLLVVGTVAAVLVAGAVTTASVGDRTGSLLTEYDASFRQTG
jgi:RPA family protein